ncbi:hypothetical protein PENTCL1PPCAC_17219, partial [Pristionchus entomophagus]
TCHYGVSGTCTGDICVTLFGFETKSKASLGQQHCLSGIPALNETYRGCYDLDEGGGLICF